MVCGVDDNQALVSEVDAVLLEVLDPVCVRTAMTKQFGKPEHKPTIRIRGGPIGPHVAPVASKDTTHVHPKAM